MNFDVFSCEKQIGYTFKDKQLLINAFTHASFVNEHKNSQSNERMEFLGDSILGFVVAEELYRRFPNEDEGALTLKKQALVSKKPLSAAIIKVGLNKFLQLGEGERLSKSKINLSENLFESIVAAIYLDGGLASAKNFIFSLLSVDSCLNVVTKEEVLTDYKSQLLHFVQQNKLGEIEYFEVSKSGPPHKPIFTMAVKVNGKTIATAEGSSHKDGEKSAAKIALSILQSEE